MAPFRPNPATPSNSNRPYIAARLAMLKVLNYFSI
ncbi:uncharacterized protein ANIA_11620 [Aspergillus nidulans FGSC A4]|uniref:Uncharacterized protein n=1 Tax=Emericella nidulans (strain FGSC A4 / ATCC 38163 / CBS 112.46 / NRRL 194 / M139) TaxID=227321 RepID=C8VEQ9_EMENI|nr:hypothetical protein [Aspergillus nidulans FGSC A4]CBF80761.1 TPA: hypothetical protein ANIA_11620 [Aspergillus nidulans FGSC A4]